MTAGYRLSFLSAVGLGAAAAVVVLVQLRPGLDQLRSRQPHLLPAGPLDRIQPATIRVSHQSGIPQNRPAVTGVSNLRN
jgi:hypothetical protein